MEGFEKANTMAKIAYDAIKSISQEEIKVLDVTEITTIADIFIIVTAKNTRAVAGLSDIVEEKLAEAGYHHIGKEGYNTARWILLDFNGLMIHLFHQEEAEFYNLDKLWSDAKIIDIEA